MKRKGFTLVELLAVIVILAIIALITTVVVINIIETVKIRKYKVEEKSLEKAAELYYTNSQIFPFQDEMSLNTLVEKGFINSVKDTGNGSTCEGKVIKDNNGELKGCLKCSNYVTEGCGYVKDDEKDDDKKDDDEIKDENLGIICGSGTEEDYDNQKECHIKSVEDLVAFSTLVNSGKTFKEKTVYLDKDLNMILNGNFEPIGTSTNQFEGKFDGNAHTISNLRISKQNDNYVGLFGYVGGINSTNYATIVGLNVENTNVSGNSYVGGIAGYANSYTTINEVTVSGNIKGTSDYVGGVIGFSQSYTKVTSVIVNANVEGKTYVGGIAGSGLATYSGIVEYGKITGTNYVYGSGKYISNSYINSNVILSQENGDPKLVGKTYDNSKYGNLNLYNDYIDTWLGGDDDNSGYYFDYESDTSNKIVLKKGEINLNFKNGTGTSSDPYLIENYDDMKKLSAVTKTQTEKKYYKLTTDLNYSNKHYYMVGTKKQPFKSVLDGGAHTLSNIGVYGYDYVGLFGYVGGINSTNYATIVGLNVENTNVSGNSYVGGIAGYANSYTTINEVTVSGNIKGNGDYVGGIIGSSQSYTNLTGAIVNANVEGNNYVGGLAGGGKSTYSGIVESGEIKGTNNVYGSGRYISNSYINSNNVTLTQQNENPTLVGKTYVDSNYGNLNLYNDYIDTWLGGDNDNSGYYFDYESETSNKIVLRSNQIDTTFEKGSGTKEDPYLIESYEDMKKLSAVTKEQVERKYYKLTKNLNYEDRHYYMIGTKTSQFKGVLDGGAHTLSNIGVYGYDYVGLFGYVGGINSTNYATIVGLNVENTNVSGNSYVGGIAGYANSYTTINEVTVSGNIKGTSDYVGGVIGFSQSYTKVTSVIVNANVEGKTYVGGIAGSGLATYSGIVEYGKITGTNYVYGSGKYISNAYINEKVIKNVPNTASTDWNGTVFPETSYNNLEDYSNLKVGSTPIIETQYSGDTDKSGYYFGYNNATKENIVVIPAVN